MKDMYEYLGEYPKNRRNGWNKNLQGVCHDDKNWFFTQTEKLWKFPVGHPLNEKVEKADPVNGILMLDYRKFRNDHDVHLGDIDYFCYNEKGYIFAPVEEDGEPYIAVFSAEDLSFITKQTIKRNGRYYEHLAWCAINPNDGCLYTSDGTVKCTFEDEASPIVVYSVDYEAVQNKSGNFLNLLRYLYPTDEDGHWVERKETQGGCFDDKNHLHISNGYGWGERSNDDFGIAVFDVPADATTINAKMITHSRNAYPFKFEFHSFYGEEVEGLTYWDLTERGKAPHIRGVLHVIMLDNDIGDKDDIYFKHYDIIV